MSLDNIISFEVPDHYLDSGLHSPDVGAFSEGNQQAIRSALEEIYSTPEGRRLLEQAAETSPSGQLHIVSNPGGISRVEGLNDGVIFIGGQDDEAQYFSDATGSWHNLSIQRVIVHEANHHVMGHMEELGNGDITYNQMEAEAMEATNRFMRRYYQEPPRSTNFNKLGVAEDGSYTYDGQAITIDGEDFVLEDGTRLNILEVAGTRLDGGGVGWEYNQNFGRNPLRNIFDPAYEPISYNPGEISPNDMLDHLNTLSASELEAYGPEMEALYELRDMPEQFEAMMVELQGNSNFLLATMRMNGASMNEITQTTATPEQTYTPSQAAPQMA